MKTAAEIEQVMGYRPWSGQRPYTYREWFHDHVYIPYMTKLISDMRVKGLLPKDPL